MEDFLGKEDDEEKFNMMYSTMDDKIEEDNDDIQQLNQEKCTALENLSVSLETSRQGYTHTGTKELHGKV